MTTTSDARRTPRPIVITIQSADRCRLDVTPAQYDILAAGQWPMSPRGESLSGVHFGAHYGSPTIHSDETIREIAAGTRTLTDVLADQELFEEMADDDDE